MGLVYLVQHAEKRPEPGDPELTEHGRTQAADTALWLSRAGLFAVYSSPLRRAWQTARAIATTTGLDIRRDDRLRERMNWDGSQPIEDFLADWARSVRDRDFVPRSGDSSWQAAARLHAFLREQEDAPAAMAVVTHGGITADLLRTLLGDHAVPASVMYQGVPACAITTLEGLKVVDVARTDHLFKYMFGPVPAPTGRQDQSAQPAGWSVRPSGCTRRSAGHSGACRQPYRR